MTSCSKDEIENVNIDDIFLPPSAAEFQGLREIAMRHHTQTAFFMAEDGIDYLSNDGTQLRIFPNCLTQNGNSVSGEVELSFVELYDRHNMAPTNKPVMGLKPNGDKAMLISGGEFMVEVRQNGELLDSDCGYQLVVPGDLTGGVDSEMILWKGTIDENGDLNWEEMPAENGGRMFIEFDDYYVFVHDFGWTNIDKFYDDPRDKTTIRVKAPEGFDYQNSALYLSYDGEPNGLAQLDTFDEISGEFSEHYGQIPIGLEVHLIFLTTDGDNWRYATQGVTIEENEVYTFNLEDTEVGTREDLDMAIEMLP